MSTTETTSRFESLPGGIGRYIDRDGEEREVCIDRDRGGTFRVIDLGAETTYLVDRIAGVDEDQRLSARVVAGEYRAEIGRYLAGERAEMPSEHPLGDSPIVLAEYAPKKRTQPKNAAKAPAAPARPRRPRTPKTAPGQESMVLELAA
jgi:hypothetical protein